MTSWGSASTLGFTGGVGRSRNQDGTRREAAASSRGGGVGIVGVIVIVLVILWLVHVM
jgi:uncharacterized spore protein YtfJ